MIYLDNAATSFPKAPGVSAAMAKFLDQDAANPGRSAHSMAVRAERMLEDARIKLTRLFEGDDHQHMVFTLNCTDSLNMAIKGVLHPGAQRRPHVITTVLEHNSVSRPLEALSVDGQIELTRVDCDDDGFVDPDAIRRAISPHTRLIVMTHASNVLGTLQDAAEVGAIARAHDVLFLLDAAQSAGIVPISIRQMKVDLLAVPGHKSLLGPTGVGCLYVGPRCPQPPGIINGSNAVVLQPPDAGAPRFKAWREGGTGGDSSARTQPPDFPYYLEGGTPNTVGVAGLAVAVDFILNHSMANRLGHERTMIQTVINRLGDDRRFTVYGSRDVQRHVGAVSVNVEGYDAVDVGAILDDSFEIAVRAGLHCAPYAHRRFGTFSGGTVRISPGPFNTDHHLEQLLNALDQIAGSS